MNLLSRNLQNEFRLSKVGIVKKCWYQFPEWEMTKYEIAHEKSPRFCRFSCIFCLFIALLAHALMAAILHSFWRQTGGPVCQPPCVGGPRSQKLGVTQLLWWRSPSGRWLFLYQKRHSTQSDRRMNRVLRCIASQWNNSLTLSCHQAPPATNFNKCRQIWTKPGKQ